MLKDSLLLLTESVFIFFRFLSVGDHGFSYHIIGAHGFLYHKISAHGIGTHGFLIARQLNCASCLVFVRRRGVKVIEINADPSPISNSVSVFLKGKAGEIIPRLVDMVLAV